MKTILGAFCLLAMLAASFAYGEQTGQQKLLTVNVSFQFRLADKEFPAGLYTFSRSRLGEAIDVVGADNVTTRVPIITRLAAGIHTTPKDSHLVFDKVGDNRYLSEIWVPGVDGFMLRTLKAKHEHEIVDIPR